MRKRVLETPLFKIFDSNDDAVEKVRTIRRGEIFSRPVPDSPHLVIAYNKAGVEVSHCCHPNLESAMKQVQVVELDHRVANIMPQAEYFERFANGEFTLGKDR